jgi:hypothetical protein
VTVDPAGGRDIVTALAHVQQALYAFSSPSSQQGPMLCCVEGVHRLGHVCCVLFSLTPGAALVRIVPLAQHNQHNSLALNRQLPTAQEETCSTSTSLSQLSCMPHTSLTLLHARGRAPQVSRRWCMARHRQEHRQATGHPLRAMQPTPRSSSARHLPTEHRHRLIHTVSRQCLCSVAAASTARMPSSCMLGVCSTCETYASAASIAQYHCQFALAAFIVVNQH